jgi:hypothetical protein
MRALHDAEANILGSSVGRYRCIQHAEDIVTYFGVFDSRQVMDWILHLLTICIHPSELHFTDHWHTQTSVLSLLQSPIAVPWQQLLPMAILQLSTL